MLAVGVGDEYLSETIARYQVHNLFHPVGIKLVEDVVEQQNWCRMRRRVAQEVELRKLQTCYVSLVLSLRTFSLYQMSAKCALQIVAVDSV